MKSEVFTKVALKNGLEAVIAPACRADATEMLECFKAVAEEGQFVLSTLTDIERVAPNVEKEAEWVKTTFNGGGLILTAKIGGKIAGYISVCIDQMVRKRHIAVIGICTSKQYRGIGIGKALMQSVIKWAKENPTVKKLALSVFADNTAAIKLYEKLGFLTEGCLPCEICRGENDYVDTIMMYMFV